MEKKLIFFDIDGTLISYKNETYIPPETIEAISKLKENGHIIAVSTGRSFCTSKYILEKLDIHSAVLHNGAQIIYDNEIIYEKRIGVRISNKICKMLSKTELCVFAFDGANVYINNITEDSKKYIEFESKRADIIKPLSDNKNSLFSINLYGDYTQIPEFLFSIKSIDFKERYYEITAKGISKSNGLIRLAKQLNISRNNIIAVGDGINDIDMIKVAGVGIAVGNACQELKDAADLIADDIEDGGIMKAFKALKLI